VTLLDPRQSKALVNLGAVYNSMKDYNKAVGVLRKAIQRDKTSGEAYYNLGLAYRGLQQQAMAVSAYREAVRVSPLMASAHQNLANVLVDIGNMQQAIIHYNKALEIDPNFERAKRGLEKTRQASEDSRKAVSPFGRLVDVDAHGAKAAPRVERELTDLERYQDRAAMFEHAMEIQDAANLFLKHVREDFDTCLTALNRMVAQGSEGPSLLMNTYRDYVAALKLSIDAGRR
jgi:tetratricopeptide (TPR) repeat protein